MMAKEPVDDGSERQKLAGRLTMAGIAGITVLGVSAIYFSEQRGAAAEHVMAAVLPLFGSWIATVLAYYFAKENLRAATNSVSTLMSSKDKDLEAVFAKDKMINRTRIVTLSDKFPNVGATTLKDILAYLNEWKVSRSPIFGQDKLSVVEIVHTSTINDFVRQEVAGGKTLDQLTYADLQKDPKLGKLLATSLAFVPESATLAEAQAKMNATPECEDVFVTKTGQAAEPVLGWITDNVILEVVR